MTHGRWLAAILALLFLSGTSAEVGRTADTKKARKICGQAEQALKEGRVEEGRALFRKALEYAPDLPDAHVGLGQMAMAEKRYEDALAEFQLAEAGYVVFIKEVIKRAQANEAAQYDEMARLSDSSSQVAVSGSKSGASPMAQAKLYNAAQRLATGGNASYPTSEQLTEPMGRIYYYVGNALFRLGRVPDAAEYFEASVELAPGELPAYVNLAIARWKTGQRDEALAVLSKAEEQGLKVDPKLKADIAATPDAAKP